MHWRATVQCIVVERRKTDHVAVMKESEEEKAFSNQPF